jgi:hypothetical protein
VRTPPPATRGSASLKRVIPAVSARPWYAGVDWALRVVFFVAAPFALVRVATLVPITGTLFDVALALGVLFFGEALRGRAQSSALVRRTFAQAFAFDDHYRVHPPRPFLYYAVYPLLFPYWLWNRAARREFLVFKGYTVLSVTVLFLTNVYSFLVLYRPELGFREFVRPLLMGFAVESVMVLALLMPLVTTVVALHRAEARVGLFLLLALGALSTGVGITRLVLRRAPIVSLETRQRVVMRTAKNHEASRVAMTRALNAAREAQRRNPAAMGVDGTLQGAPRDAARAELPRFYRKDEANAFDLWMTGEPDPKLMVLYAEGRRERRPIWLALRDDGSPVKNARDLPHAARRAMKEAGQF